MRRFSFPQSVRLCLLLTIATLCLGALLAPEQVAAQAAGAVTPPSATDPTRNVQTTWPPKGQPVKVAVTRDTWVSSMGTEKTGNNGGASTLKLKGHQEMSIIDIEPAALKGKIITGALLHMKSSSPKEPIYRLTVSSFAAPWVEGTATGYAEQEGSSCWSFARFSKDPAKAVPWTFVGSLFVDAGFGLSHTIWKFADATAPDAEGWQTVAVDADVIAARVAGISYGLALWEDIGSEWSYKNDKFTYINNPNRFIYSREQSNGAPWLEVWVDGTDTQPPEAVSEKGFEVSTKDYPAGQAMVTWLTPADQGGAKTLGFNVSYKAGSVQKQMPRYLVPMAAAVGKPVRMHIQDLPFKAGEEITLTISAVDSAGNVGKPLVKAIKLSDNPAVFPIAKADIEPFAPSADLPEVGGLKVAILDLIDKVDAKSGKMIPEQPEGYKGGNHLWSAEKKIIRLQAGRNEFIGFLVNLEGKSPSVTLKLDLAQAGARSKVYRLDYVKAGGGVVPDAAVPLVGPLAIPFKGDPEAAEQTNACVLCEVYVPHEAKAGEVKGSLQITSAGQNLQIPVELTIWDFTLPNKLSFVPEMNAYGTVEPDAKGIAYYRLAHEHRTVINRLPYGWNGEARLAPKWNGQTFDWTEWDRQYGPILSGTAFSTMPRKGEPVDKFYLPFNESWPVPIWDHFTKSYWPEDAFTEEYREGMKKAYAEFVKHLKARGWTGPEYQFYLNNKVYYKANEGVGWKGSSAPWIFDEPRETQDFWALRWYGILWHQAVDPVKSDVKAWYRGDISRSDYGRNTMWGVLDIDYFGGSNDHKARQKHDENRLYKPTYFCEYGGANDPGTSNIAPVTWCILAWSRGAIGVLPWQTIGESAANWNTGESTCVFYPPKDNAGPVASIRLKAFRQGQQDVEYLTLLGDAYNAPHYAVAAGLKQVIDLSGRVIKRSEEDAGIIKFDKVDATNLWKMRYAVGKMISAKKPAYKRVIREFPSPVLDMNDLPDIGYVKVAPKVEPARPD